MQKLKRKSKNYKLKFKTFDFLVIVLPFYFLLFTLFSGCATMPRTESGIPTIALHGTAYLSLISLSNKMNLDCDYDSLTRKIVLTRDASEIKLLAGSRIALVNNNPRNIKYPVELYQGQVLVPLSFKQGVLDSLYPAPPQIKKEAAQPGICYTVRRIIIDAGHGGHDPGAIGRYGLREKDVVLDITQRLRRVLEAQGIDVIMTRNSDRFVSLSGRSDIANRSKADLFVSIHANANPSRRLSGFEVYYLSEKIDDRARALAAAENASLDLDKASFNNASLSLKATLWDMIYTQNRSESIDLAKDICQSANEQMGLRILGVKGAPFYVLKGTRMPAVLVEVGFVSNLQEEKFLRNSYYRQQIADAIAQGIINYRKNFQVWEAKR